MSACGAKWTLPLLTNLDLGRIRGTGVSAAELARARGRDDQMNGGMSAYWPAKIGMSAECVNVRFRGKADIKIWRSNFYFRPAAALPNWHSVAGTRTPGFFEAFCKGSASLVMFECYIVFEVRSAEGYR